MDKEAKDEKVDEVSEVPPVDDEGVEKLSGEDESGGDESLDEEAKDEKVDHK